MTAANSGQFERALELLRRLPDSVPSRTKRLVKIEALRGLGRHDELLEILSTPETPDEAIMAVSMLLEADRFDDAETQLEAGTPLLDPATFKDLTAAIAARRMLNDATS